MSLFIESTPDPYLFEAAYEFSSEYPPNWTHFNENSIGGNLSDFRPCGGGPNNLGRYISMILFTVVCIIGLFGNTLVIYVVLR